MEKYFDEDTAARSRLILVQMDDRQNVPADGIGTEHMSEEPRNISQPISFITMYCFIVFGKRGFEKISPEAVKFGESLSDEPIEFRVSAFLGTAFHDHGRELRLLAGRQIDLHEFVATLLKINAGHDREVDGSAEVDQVSVALVFNIHLTVFLVLLVVF